MRIALIADAYPPNRTSAAVQMRDLARALADAGHEPVMIVPASDQQAACQIDHDGLVEIVRLRAPRTKNVGYLRRSVAELALPHAMWRNLRGTAAAGRRFDGIVWYSPTIFLAPLVRRMKRRSGCRTYLIVRDIFPEWAADMGLMRRGAAFRVLRRIARGQYRLADAIGVQTPANFPLVAPWAGDPAKVELLENWLAPLEDKGCPIRLSDTNLRGRKIFLYVGNMGVAQGVGSFLNLADALRDRDDIGFAFVGYGSDAARLRASAAELGLDNVAFFGEIDPDHIPALYRQAQVGLVALDPRHKTHNIPGKFISYMHAGLPVLANINPGNELAEMIHSRRVGRAVTGIEGDDLRDLAIRLLDEELDDAMRARCRALAMERFSAQQAAAQIIAGLMR